MDKLFPDLVAVFAAAILIFIIYKLLAKLFGKIFYKTATENGIVLRYSKLLRRAAVKSVIWSGEGDMTFRLPEKYGNCKIISLGDDKGFSVDISDPGRDWMDSYAFRQSHVKNADLPEYEIKFEIGQYVRDISAFTMLFGHVGDTADDQKPLAKVKYVFSVDERNENLCSKRGKLYYSDGSRVVETIPQ